MRVKRFAAVVVALLVAGLPGIASANHSGPGGIVGGFEVDGDFDFDGLVAGGEAATRDWETITPVIGSTDAGNSSTDDIFTGGSKENEPNNWVFGTGKPSGKSDLIRGYAASEVTETDSYLWLAFERLAIQGNGSANVNFEINRKRSKIVNGAGTLIPERSTDDLLVIYDYAGGSNPVAIGLRRWQGQTDNPLTPQNEEALFGEWVSVVIPANDAFGDINNTLIARPVHEPFGGGDVQIRRFGEVGLNVTGIFGPDFLGCPGFGSFWVKTRASGSSFNSALEDFTQPAPADFSTCSDITVEKVDDDGSPLNGATFTLYADDGDGSFTALDQAVGTCVSGEEGASGRCTFEQVEPGDYWVQETAAPDGYVVDPTVSAVTVGFRDQITVSHTYVNTKIRYRLTLTPEQANNLTGTDHVVTSLLERSLDGGATWDGASGETVSFELLGEGTITGITPAGPDADSCSTDGDGECEVTFTSDDAGDSTLRATFEKITATSPVTASGEAGKTWVNYRISVTPGSDTNVAGTPHVFTVTLERTTDGETWTGVSGASIDIELSGVGEVTENTCDSTAADGTCTVTITSATAGESTLTASYLAVEGDTSSTFSASATKQWLDFRIAVSPDGQVNPVRTGDGETGSVLHTFTVTIEQTADGQTWTGVEGAHPSIELSGVGEIVSNDCEDIGTGADGTCTVVITSDTAGQSTVTATYLAAAGNSSRSFSASADKFWEDYAIDVDPPSAFNRIGEPHTFTITLTRDQGDGFEAYAGQTVELMLDPGESDAEFSSINDEPASGTEATCVSDADGVCTATINATTPGTVTLTATWNGTVGGVDVSFDADAVKTYLAITLTKGACPSETSPPGGVVEYDIELTVAGAPLTNATVTDDLPGGVRFGSASTLAGVEPVTPAQGDPNGQVVWSFASLPEGTYEATITVTVDTEATAGDEIVNTVTLDADEIDPQEASWTITVAFGGEASARAFGLRAELLGSLLVEDTPDSDEASPDQVLEIPIPGVGSVSLLHVDESDDSEDGVFAASAVATTAAVDLDLGAVHVQASTIVARSASRATVASAGSSAEGSRVQDLVINDTTYGDLTGPKTIAVTAPDGTPIAEVYVLERQPTGAAAGEIQPNDNSEFASGLAVNGLRVRLLDGDLTEITVAHTQSDASAPSGIGCATQPGVGGEAYVLSLHNVTPDVGSARIGQVTLPITGGNESAVVTGLDLPVGTSATGGTSTQGSVTADTASATSTATLEDLDLLDGAVTATLARAEATADLDGASGTATIADLAIGDNHLCGVPNVCRAPPNTVLLIPGGPVLVMLNEQLPTEHGITVNAVHIWVLGQDNPLGLPVGAEIVISSATAEAFPAPEPPGPGDGGDTDDGDGLAPPTDTMPDGAIPQPVAPVAPVALVAPAAPQPTAELTRRLGIDL